LHENVVHQVRIADHTNISTASNWR